MFITETGLISFSSMVKAMSARNSSDNPQPLAASTNLHPANARADQTQGSTSSWRALGLKLVVSGWLVYHLCGIFIAPASVAPSSRLTQNTWRLFGSYLQFMYMNHGFHFFAPDPGAATILRYELELPNQAKIIGQIPDKNQHQPRLFYHRHFMLTEFMATSDGPEFKEVQPLLIRAFARQLCREHGATSVKLTRVVHLLPTPEWRKAGMPFDAKEMFEETSLGTFACSDL
jgi:hypothetical protein